MDGTSFTPSGRCRLTAGPLAGAALSTVAAHRPTTPPMQLKAAVPQPVLRAEVTRKVTGGSQPPTGVLPIGRRSWLASASEDLRPIGSTPVGGWLPPVTFRVTSARSTGCGTAAFSCIGGVVGRWAATVLRAAPANGPAVNLHRPDGVKLVPSVVSVEDPSAGQADVVAQSRRREVTTVARHELG